MAEQARLVGPDDGHVGVVDLDPDDLWHRARVLNLGGKERPDKAGGAVTRAPGRLRSEAAREHWLEDGIAV